jgi:cell shape-determining protein MreC
MATFILLMLAGFVVWFVRALFQGMSNAKHWAADKVENVVDNIEAPSWVDTVLNKAAEAEDVAKTTVEVLKQSRK